MPKRRKYNTPEKVLKHKIKQIKKANIKKFHKKTAKELELLPLSQRIKSLLDISTATYKKYKMLFMVMYDIENDKIRNEIAKYLIRKGCIRIQKSVYIANLDRKIYNEIHSVLKEIQQMYDNHDSIIMIPISADEVRSMKIIGQNIDIDLILGNKNVLFF